MAIGVPMDTNATAEGLFLHLLSAAIYNVEPESYRFASCSDDQWQAIIRLARQQSVLALVAERILRLPVELMPARAVRLELGLSIQLVERESQRVLSTLAAVAEDYEAEQLSFVLLKGPTMAQYYPMPMLRSPGDLDLYLWRAGDYERANAYAASCGYRLQGTSLYEQLYWRGKTAVENHRLIAYFGVAKYDEALAEIMRPIAESDGWAFTRVGERRYRTLPIELDAVYCFQHILHHFSYLGIGFRQVCDWLLLLERHSERIDLDRFIDYAGRLDLLRPMGYFALMAVRHLGASPTVFPFALPQGAEAERLANVILADILRGGNFGLEHFAGKRFRSIWGRRWFMLLRTTQRALRVAPIAPEHIAVKPLVAIATRLKLLFRH